MALFDTNSGLENLLGNSPNLFMTTPSYITGLLTKDEQDKLKQQALLKGLVGTAATYLATPKNQNYGSALPYLAKSYIGGMGAAQDVYDASTKNALDRLTLEKTAKTMEMQGMTELDKLIAQRDKIAQLNPNDPKLKIYDDAIKTKSTRGEGLNINLGQPMTAINPKTGKEELVQFPNRPGEKPIFTGLQKPEAEVKLKPVPAGPATAFSENNTAIKKIDDAIAKVEDASDDTFGVKNYLGGAITQRIDPKGTAARAAVAGVGGQKYHDLSGAAVAIQEAARLSPYIPQVTDTKQKVLENLNNLKQEYTYTNDTLTSTFNEDQGYRPLNVKAATQTQQQTTEPKQSQSVPNAPKVGQVMNGYKFKGGNPADKNNWEKM
jgi:hypothetical protein